MATSFRKLADTYRDKIYSFALYSLRRHEEAEDVTQEVLIKLWQNREGIDPDRMQAWVMRVTRNAVIDNARRRRTRVSVIDEGTDVELAANYAVTDPGIEEQMQNREFREDLRVALNNLDEPYRTLLVMREIQDLKYNEIVDAMGIPLNTVKVYLHRGRKMLRDALKHKYQRNRDVI